MITLPVWVVWLNWAASVAIMSGYCIWEMRYVARFEREAKAAQQVAARYEQHFDKQIDKISNLGDAVHQARFEKWQARKDFTDMHAAYQSLRNRAYVRRGNAFRRVTDVEPVQ